MIWVAAETGGRSMEGSTRKPVILIVDDEPQNVEILGNILTSSAVIKVATSGTRALETMAKNQIDLVLLDIGMPDLDGYEVCKRIKSSPGLASIPVIFVTSHDQEGDELHGFNLGAVDYITKPFSPPLVRARIAAHIALRNALAEVEKQNEKLRGFLQLREDVERITRHDLKGPLSPILGFSELLLLADNLDTEQKDNVAMIRSAGLRLLQMINQSLDLYKIEAGTYKIKPHPVDLLNVFESITREQKSLWEHKSSPLQLTLDCGESNGAFVVNGEESLLYTMFTNLFKNAWEATPPGFPVAVSLKLSPWAEIRVKNHGAVPLEIRNNFFEKFVTAGKRGGTGLGAYSARLMARIMHGDMTMESDEATTTIVVSLPTSSAEPSDKNFIKDKSASGRFKAVNL